MRTTKVIPLHTNCNVQQHCCCEFPPCIPSSQLIHSHIIACHQGPPSPVLGQSGREHRPPFPTSSGSQPLTGHPGRIPILPPCQSGWLLEEAWKGRPNSLQAWPDAPSLAWPEEGPPATCNKMWMGQPARGWGRENTVAIVTCIKIHRKRGLKLCPSLITTFKKRIIYLDFSTVAQKRKTKTWVWSREKGVNGGGGDVRGRQLGRKKMWSCSTKNCCVSVKTRAEENYIGCHLNCCKV